ncbi:MAG: CBS domain-containing protein [Nitrosotalea sp.]
MLTAREIMSKKVITMESTTSPIDIAKIMHKNNVSCVIVTQNEKPSGIITERSFLSQISTQNKKPSDVKSTEIMSSPVTTVSASASIDDVAQTMLEGKIRHVLVVNNNQSLGIISVTDFLKHIGTIIADSDNYKKDLYENLFEEYEYCDSQ